MQVHKVICMRHNWSLIKLEWLHKAGRMACAQSLDIYEALRLDQVRKNNWKIATLAQDTCSTVKTFCQAHVPHVNGEHLSTPAGIPNTKQDESVHVDFSDRGEAHASKGRFISPLGTWHRFPFDGELFPTRWDGGWRCRPRPHHRLAVPGRIDGRHVRPTLPSLSKCLGEGEGKTEWVLCVCVCFFRSDRWFQLLNLFV